MPEETVASDVNITREEIETVKKADELYKDAVAEMDKED